MEDDDLPKEKETIPKKPSVESCLSYRPISGKRYHDKATFN